MTTRGHVTAGSVLAFHLRAGSIPNRTTDRDAGKPTGFTLTEMLVVVSIICLLFSVLLPSFNRAMKKSEQVHCLANQRQLYLAWALYSTNNNDELPSSLDNLKRYAASEDVFVCKAQTDLHSKPSYGISNTMGGLFRDGVTPYKRFHEISHITGSLVFMDMDSHDEKECWPLLRDSKQKKWLWRPPDLFGLSGITDRHANGCNMTFADSHGEMIRWKDPRTTGLIKGTFVDEVEASNQNTDLDYLVRVMVGSRLVQDANDIKE
jgi:prepilin-type N-terminal cleavage/methylation domain-containing protein/prepilin-type processing-associated H-X9-DG protein